MTKYTINKGLEKAFVDPIWKIEVNTTGNNLAVECRNQQSTIPTFSIFTFEGENIMEQFPVIEKEWTLETIQGEYLILKKYGTSSPNQAGIQIVHIPTKTTVITFAEYVLKEVYQDTIVAVHRSIPSGLVFYIDIGTGQVTNNVEKKLTIRTADIEYPIIYKDKLPHFMQHIDYEDHIWLLPCPNFFIWTYHLKTHNGYALALTLSTKNEILDHVIVLHNLPKLILQPFFKVKGYIFFLSDTKQEIATYLV